MSSIIRAQAIYLVLFLLLCNVLALRKWPSTLVPLSGAESKGVVETLSNLEDSMAQGTGARLMGMDDGLSPSSTQLKIGAVIKALDLVGAHAKDAGLAGLKLVAVLSVSRMLIKTVMRWYVDFTKDELLFDSRDHRYRNFGAIFHDAASTTILASSALRGKLHVDNGDESLILDHLMNCLNVNCFTHTMQDFSVVVQDELAATIEVANAHRRVTGCGHPGAAAWIGSSSSSRRAPAFTSVYFAATALLVVRQADAQLRLARNHLMRSATRLEDYLEHLSSKVVYDNTWGHFEQLSSHIRFVSEPLRNAAATLFPKVFRSQRRLGKLGKVKGIVAAIDSSHHRERLTAVKEWIDDLYIKLEVVQDHLDELQIIEAKRSSKRLSALPSNVLPWSQRAFELCQESAEALRNEKSDREVDATTVMAMTKTTKKWETSLTNKIAVRKASSRQIQRAIHEMNDAAKDSGKAVRAMPEYFRARLDIETRIGDVMSVRHRTRLGLMNTMRFCGQHFASAAKLAVTLLVVVGGVRIRRNSDLISQKIDLIRSSSKGFLERRVVGPAVSILNDVVLNKKVAITDHAALKDSQRSLATMLDDFLTQYKPQMPSEERAKRVARMDMTDVSLEYEQELKKPMQNIMSGRIARLALIQGQFVKKELLVAMQAIDDLVNANQVNLQLLAVMPAIMIGFMVSSGIKALLTTARSFNRGSSRLVQTKQMVRRDLKNGFRALERQLLVNAREVSHGTAASDQDTARTSRGRGRTMCILYRMHRTIMDKSELMGDDALVKQLLQDLSDLMTPNLLPERQIALLKLCLDNL